MSDLLERAKVRAAEATEAVKKAEALRDEVLEQRRHLIIAMHASGLTTRQLGAIFGVTAPRISKIMDSNSPPRSQRNTKKRQEALRREAAERLLLERWANGVPARL